MNSGAVFYRDPVNTFFLWQGSGLFCLGGGEIFCLSVCHNLQMIPQKDSDPGKNTEQEAERNGGGKGDVCYSGYSYHYVAYHEATSQPEENAGDATMTFVLYMETVPTINLLPLLNLLFQDLRRICFRVSQVRTILVWQVCLASVCLHIRRKSNCILCVLASRLVCTVPLLPNCSPGLCRFLRVLCSSCSPILLFIIRCTILARRCTVLWCVQFLLW